MADEPEPITPRTLCDNDLYLFGGMAALLVAVSVLSYWIADLRAVAALQVGNLIGAGTMYLRGK
jgi:hypothetical protein